jgi:hypothetical protein
MGDERTTALGAAGRGSGATKPESIGYEWPSKYKVLDAMYCQLPKTPKWTATVRDQWLSALAASLDVQIEIVNDDDA